MALNDGILDFTSDPALLFEELGPFAIPFDDCLLDPPLPSSGNEGELIDALPTRSAVPSHLDNRNDVGPTLVDQNDMSALQPFDPLFDSNEFDNAQFGSSLSSLDLTIPSTTSRIGSPRTLAFLVEINEILSNSILAAENGIQTETNSITALDDTTLKRRHVGQLALRTRDAGGGCPSSLQEAREGDKVKEMKDLQLVFPVNPKSKAGSEDRSGDLKPRRYTPFQ
jgi:hypothetical protein